MLRSGPGLGLGFGLWLGIVTFANDDLVLGEDCKGKQRGEAEPHGERRAQVGELAQPQHDRGDEVLVHQRTLRLEQLGEPGGRECRVHLQSSEFRV